MSRETNPKHGASSVESPIVEQCALETLERITERKTKDGTLQIPKKDRLTTSKWIEIFGEM